MDLNLLFELGLESGGDQDKDEEAPKKAKRRRGKMSKKLLLKQQEEARLQAIAQKKKNLDEVKEKVHREWDTNREKRARFKEEQQIRVYDFMHCYDILGEIDEEWKEFQYHRWKQEEWNRYLVCNKLPHPTIIPDMNTYLSVWRDMDFNTNVPTSVKMTENAMTLLNELDELITMPWPAYSKKDLASWKALRSEYRDMLQYQIDMLTYRTFRRIETDMNAIDVTTSQYYLETKHFLIHLWAELMTPVPMGKAQGSRHELKINFTPLGMKVIIPEILLDVHKAIRVMLLFYDQWSDRCRSYEAPLPPKYLLKDLLQAAVEEFNTRTEAALSKEELVQRMKAKIAKLPVPSLSQEILLWEDEYQRLVSDGISFREAQEEERWRSTVKLNLDEHEVNLREREFIGGVITFEIFHQPPQPKYLRYKHDVTLLREPPRLQPVEYQVTLPSAKHDGGTDEDRLLRKRRDVQGARKEDLIFVSLNLPQSVLWLEIPDIALWNNEKQYWSTEFIHEQYYDDEDGRLTFKTGCIGLFGFHISRFCNLPYKDWRLESDGKGGVNFYLKADKITLNFNIKDDKVCLSSVEDVPSSPIDSIFNTYYIPIKLVQVMKSFGVNVFPEIDTHFYLPDSISKHGVCERFVYQIWGIFSSSFCFKFSKFNRERERRTMVFQLREVYDSFDTSFCLIKTTPSEACILDITESAEEYTPRVAPLYKVYTNVYDLIMRNSSTMARRRAEVENFVLIQTIRDFLGLVRPLSFS